MRLPVVIVFLLTTAIADASTNYFVRTDGHDTARGTNNTSDATTGAFLTIQKGHDVTAAGDAVYVADGSYPERVTVTHLGTAANYISFIGNKTGTGVVMRGFNPSSVGFVKIIGFEMTHVNTTFRSGVYFSGNCSNIMILDNYIHDISQEGTQTDSTGTNSYITIRGNTFYYMQHPGSLQVGDASCVNGSQYSHHWLVEYNKMQRGGVDYIDLYGQSNILRNNFLLDFRDSYWSTVGHPDGFQPGSDGAQTQNRHQLIERNFVWDIPSGDGHFGLFQDTISGGDTNIVIRGNVGEDIGNAGIGVIGTDYVQTYHNLFFNMLAQSSSANIWNWYSTTTIGGLLINSLAAHMLSGVPNVYAINVDPGHVVTVTNNMAYVAGAHPSFITTNVDILFNSTNAPGDFRLQSSSTAHGQGRYITTITNASGSGTSFGVPDKHVFKDGWGIAEGDLISTSNQVRRISSIDWDTHVITIAGSSITWTNNQPVYWDILDKPALGPYGSNAVLLADGATYTVAGTTYTAVPVGDARMAVFYVDNIPTITVYDSPYQATIASGTVRVRFYPKWAQTSNHWVEAVDGTPGPTITTITGNGKGKTRGRSR